MIKVLVCIPTFNNENTILNVISNVKKYSSDILVINDGCTDYTSDLLLEVNGINLITLPVNFGKGNALKRAFHFAEKNGYNYILSFDANGRHLGESIPSLISSLFHDKVLVIGNRSASLGWGPASFSMQFKKILSNILVFIETGIFVKDTQSGLRVYPVDFDVLDGVNTSNYDFEIDLLVKMIWSGYEVVSVPARIHQIEEEKKVISLENIKAILLLFRIHSLLMITRLFDYIKKSI